MLVERIVANLSTEDPERLVGFYRSLFGLEIRMNHGWIVTLRS